MITRYAVGVEYPVMRAADGAWCRWADAKAERDELVWTCKELASLINWDSPLALDARRKAMQMIARMEEA